MEKALLRFDEVMAILNVNSKDTIYNYLRDGKLKAWNPSGRPGRGTKILASSVYQLVDEGSIPTETWIE
jgi:hypothetical protein